MREDDVVMDDEARWNAVLNREEHPGEPFFYAVRTTGVYSSPTCVARPARRDNVEFFRSPQEAEEAGYRPCLRCLPTAPGTPDRHRTVVVQACRLLGRAEEPLDLGSVAAQVGMSKYHFHRVFKAYTGLTPREYLAECRAARLRRVLVDTHSVTEAIHRSGFNSHGPFYAASKDILGMTPSAYRDGGAGLRVHYRVRERHDDVVLVALADERVCAVLHGPTSARVTRELAGLLPNARLVPAEPELASRIDAAVLSTDPVAHVGALPVDIRTPVTRHLIRRALHTRRALPAAAASTAH